MSLRGQLEDLGVAEILHVVGAARRSGLLRLRSGSESADVLFRDGAVIALRGAGMPETLADLLSAGGALDSEQKSKAVHLSATQGISVDQALKALGTVAAFREQQALESEIEKRLPSLFAWRTGSFEFSLLQDAGAVTADFGERILDTGIPVARLGATRGRAKIAPDPPFETTGARRARLLMAEDRIALTAGAAQPAPPAPPPAESTAPAPLAAPSPAPRRASGRTVLHCLSSGPLRQGLLSALSDRSVDALALTSLHDLDAGVEAARARGERLVLCCHAGHPDLPGIELLARLRSIDASTPAVLLMSADWPVARQSAVAERAGRFGARLLAVVTDAGDAAAADLATRVVDLLQPPTPELPAAQPGSEATGLGLVLDAPPSRSRRHGPELATLSRMLAAAGETADIAREILSVGGEHFRRCFLFVRGDGVLEPLGAATPGEPLPAGIRAGALPALGTDFLSRAIRDGMPLDGPPPKGAGDAAVLRLLDAESAQRLAVLPLVAAGNCYGALTAVETEQDGPDLATLSAFMMEAGAALWEALSRERRRQECRRLRLGA